MNSSKMMRFNAAAQKQRQRLKVLVAQSRMLWLASHGLQATTMRPAASTLCASEPQSLAGHVTREQILGLASTPMISPSYPKGPYQFNNREYMLIEYETDMNALKKVVPWPLEPMSNTVIFEWINMPDSSGFGSYSEAGSVVPCLLDGEPVNYTLSMFLDAEPPTAAGREIWGFPKIHAQPELSVDKDTLVGTLSRAGCTAAIGTMMYKHKQLSKEEVLKKLSKKTCNLRLIPGVDGKLERAQLVSFYLDKLEVLEAWTGPARLQLLPHVTVPAHDLPVHSIKSGTHIRTNLALPYGEVEHDYLDETHEASAKRDETTRDPGLLAPEAIVQAAAMPVMSPSYPRKLSNLGKRKVIVYKVKGDRQKLLSLLPDTVLLNEEEEFLVTWVDSEARGLGQYNKFSIHIPCLFQGRPHLFNVMSVIDSGVVLNASREILGEPCKFGQPEVSVDKDTLRTSLTFGQQLVATGTIPYHHEPLGVDEAAVLVGTPELTLKFIPGVNGEADVAQLIRVNYEAWNIDPSSCFKGKGRLSTSAHVNAPVSDLVDEDCAICEGYHFKTQSMRVGAVSVVHDYTLE
eukprot:m.37599 g.37599  ORF g.37599 m.37599 type:complete len:573 (+) comp10114_c0_seq1:272-1990(+)